MSAQASLGDDATARRRSLPRLVRVPASWRALLGLFVLVGAALPTPRARAADEIVLPGTADEREARRLHSAGQPIRARELAEKILGRHPESFVGHLILGRILHEQEANLPRALFHLQQARTLFEHRCGVGGARCGDAAWRWRAQMLLSLSFLCGDMDRREEELHWIELYEESYQPKRYALRAWALMKLNRFAAARRVSLEGIAQGDEEERDSCWTALCAVASEEQHFDEAYALCRQAAQRLQAKVDNGTVEYRNAGHAAYSLFHFDEAERFFQEATRRPVASYSIPWADLASLYTVEGRLAESAQSLAEARTYVLGRAPAYIYNDQARIDLSAGELLLAAGMPEPALRMIRRAQLRPDRLGGTSAHAEQESVGTSMMLRQAELTVARVLAEQRAVLPLAQAPRLLLAAADHRFEAWRAKRRAAALLSGPELLLSTCRPMHPRGANIASWLVGDLVEILGAGAVLRALGTARRLEDRRAALPYLDALEAEARLDLGSPERALTLAESAWAALPSAEIVLRARVAALAAQSAWRLGDRPSALGWYEQVVHTDPGTLRRMGIALPVLFRDDGSPLAVAAIGLLRHSPRLAEEAQGFTVQGRAQQICLVAPSGSVLGCAQSAPPTAGNPTTDPARALALAFQQQTFAPALDLTQFDLRSLEGSTTSGSKTGNELKSVIDTLSR